MGTILWFICESISFVLATAMRLAPFRRPSDDDAGQGCLQEECSVWRGREPDYDTQCVPEKYHLTTARGE